MATKNKVTEHKKIVLYEVNNVLMSVYSYTCKVLQLLTILDKSGMVNGLIERINRVYKIDLVNMSNIEIYKGLMTLSDEDMGKLYNNIVMLVNLTMGNGTESEVVLHTTDLESNQYCSNMFSNVQRVSSLVDEVYLCYDEQTPEVITKYIHKHMFNDDYVYIKSLKEPVDIKDAEVQIFGTTKFINEFVELYGKDRIEACRSIHVSVLEDFDNTTTLNPNVYSFDRGLAWNEIVTTKNV